MIFDFHPCMRQQRENKSGTPLTEVPRHVLGSGRSFLGVNPVLCQEPLEDL